MIERYPKISTSQLFCVLMLSRLSAEIAYPRSSSGTPLEALAAAALAELLRFVVALPVIIYSFKGNNVHRAVYNKCRALGWTGAAFAGLLLLAAALRTLINLSQFAVKNLIPGGTMWLVFALGAVFAVYSAVMGTEALARSGAIILVAAALITIAVMLGNIPYINARSFESLSRFGDGSSFVGDVIERAMRGGEYIIFAAMLPYVSHNRKSELGRTAILFAVFSALASLGITVMNCLVLREMYGLCEFPFLAAASLSDISLFKRLDGFAAAVWSLGAVFRSGVMALSAVNAVSEVFRAAHSAPKNHFERGEAQ